MRGPAEHMRDDLLHFAWMLRRTVDEHAGAFLRNGIGDLPFEIELFLSANLELACQPVRCGRNPGRGIASHEMQRRQHVLLAIVGRSRGQHGLQRFVAHDVAAFGERRGLPREVAARRDHGKNGLPEIGDGALGKDRIVVKDRATVVFAGDIGRRQCRDHARGSSHGFEIERDDARMRVAR